MIYIDTTLNNGDVMDEAIEFIQLGKMVIVVIAGYTIAHYVLKYIDER